MAGWQDEIGKSIRSDLPPLFLRFTPLMFAFEDTLLHFAGALSILPLFLFNDIAQFQSDGLCFIVQFVAQQLAGNNPVHALETLLLAANLDA